MSLNLKKKKKMGGKRRARKIASAVEAEEDDNMDVDEGGAEREEGLDGDEVAQGSPSPAPIADVDVDEDADDPQKSVPLTRYNAMLAVVKNTLFM